MTAGVVDERAARLLARLELTGDDVLHDRVSGRKLVLNKTSRVFWLMVCEHGTGSAAAAALAARFGIGIERATADLARFLDGIDQGQRCAGSILPGADHAVLEPTAACNGQCPHCYHGTRNDHWPAEAIPEILAKVRAEGLRSVSVTGGEVFSAHYVSRFFELATLLRAEGIELASVSTNATFLTEEVRDRILAEVPESTVFRISLDALRSDLLDRVRPGYRHLRDPYGPIRGLAEAGRPLVFTTNIWSQPITEIADIGDYLRGYPKVQAWNVRLAVPVHHGAGERTRTPARKRQLFGVRPDVRLPLRHFTAILAAHAREPFGFPVRMGNYLATSVLANPQALSAFAPGHPCREDEQLVTLKADGAITQCPILTELAPELSAGSILDDDAAGFRARLPLAGLHTDAMACAGCPVRPVCGGGCRLYSMAYDGGLTGCDEPARALLVWILTDPTGLLRQHWPGYHARMLELVGDVDLEGLYGAHVAGWDR
ncbi:radical SAM/SPASM domain-containing protein [Nocardia yamanashiensis]|uniref:radical SAM/SPASM domain-containing protein n=1 Tax=Nocardia yamanashiensis TaxID=209247 RepID=UPI000AE1DD77|nr:radical SAM protein [Nocardia yamanashiensis]